MFSKQVATRSLRYNGVAVYYSYMIHECLFLSLVGYVFWCLFQGLAPMIWFYPLNDLEISGYEAYAALWFLQIITGIKVS